MTRQQINNESIHQEYKIWDLVAEAYGYVVQFRSYQAAKKRRQIVCFTKWGPGENFVLRLIKCLTFNC